VRHAALVRSLWGPADSGDPLVPGCFRVDAALYEQRRGSKLRTGLLGSSIHSAADGHKITRVPVFDNPHVRVVLLDIEGTTTPIDFVYKTLFPYASRKLESFLGKHSREPEIQLLIEDLRAQQQIDERQGLEPPAWVNEPEGERLLSAVEYSLWLMAADSKCTVLKSLQGRIWQEGFDTGELRGEVYPDVPVAFERWRRQGREIGIYSSGSVLAQQLLFRTVISGDLTLQIAAFFDTRVGAKSDSESYKKIAASMGLPAGEILFLSDAAKEIEAAECAGMGAILCVREGHASTAAGGKRIIQTFDEIFPD
jgi:enolase-phosphatase E1